MKKLFALLLCSVLLLSLGTVAFAADSDPNSGLKNRLTPASTPASASLPLNDSLPEPFNWWSRDWYGFWLILEADGEYADWEGKWWDCCGAIELLEDGTGYFTLWDEESTYEEPFAISKVKISKDGRGPHGTLYSEGGAILKMELQHGDWAVDPKNSDYDDMLTLYGDYIVEDGSMEYVVVLRPWGHLWLDITEDDADAYSLYCYEDWYLPLLDAGVTVAPNGEVGSSE